jgi:Circularly permutated YpsA SLOG family
MLDKIISGGQTGADQGGLYIAQALGIPTGGYMPHGFRTDSGPNPELAHRFGLIETHSTHYPARTRANVIMSDGTLIFGRPSPGSKLTYNLCLQYKKPSYVVLWPINISAWPNIGSLIESFTAWLESNQIKILNVAGNRESQNPGIFRAIQTFLQQALDPYAFIPPTEY